MALFSHDSREKADSLAGKGKYKAALQLYLKLGEHCSAADMYVKLGEKAKAAETYSAGGDFPRAANLFSELGRLEEAARMFEKCRMHTEAAATYEQAGNVEDAARLFRKSGQHEDAVRLSLEMGRSDLAARVYVELGEFARAAELFETAGAYQDAADCYLRGNLKHEAATALERANALDKAVLLYEELGLHSRAGELYEEMGNYLQASERYAEGKEFSKAGKLLEDNQRLYEAAVMYERDEETAKRAADLFREIYGGEQQWELRTESNISELAVATAQGWVLAGLTDSEVVLLDADGAEMWRFKVPMRGTVRSVAIMPDISLAAIGTKERSVYLLDSRKNLLWKREFGGDVRGLGFDSEHSLVIVGSTNGRIRALTREGKDCWAYTTDYKLWDLVTHQGTRTILAGCGDSHIYLLDFDGKLIWKEDTGDWVARVSIDPQGQYAAALTGYDMINLYDLQEKKLLWQYKHSDVIQDMELARGRRIFLGCNSSACMLDFDRERLWHLPSNHRVTAVTVDKDRPVVVMGQQKYGVKAYKLSNCLIRAARNYERCGMALEAAQICEENNELAVAAELYIGVKEFAKAAPLYEQLGQIEEAGKLYERSGQHTEAALCFEQIGQIERAANCYAEAGEHRKAADLSAQIGDATKAAELHMQAGDFSKAAQILDGAGATEAARVAYEKAAEAGGLPTAGAIRLAQLYVSDDLIDDAIKLLQPITSETDGSHAALVLLADCFRRKGMFTLAANRYVEALRGEEKVSSNNIDVFYGLGVAYEQGGSYGNAHEVFQKILAADYYFKDVTNRLEHVAEMSGMFVDAGKTQVSDAGMQAASGGGGTVIQEKKRYEVIRKLGEGGMGVVYLARDTKLDRVVAWKVLPSQFNSNDELRSRFVREARAVAALNHQNIVGVFDIGEEQGRSFIAMEYVEGQPLGRILKTQKKLSLANTVEIGMQAADGLAAAHKKGIIHRDVKPDNVMITPDEGKIKIMDFGLVHFESETKLTRAGQVMGTLYYMSPEQATGRHVGPQTDVYAMGIMMFEMIAGKPPFTEGNLAFHHVNTAPAKLIEVADNITPEFSDVVAKCLEKDPRKRYADGAELSAALDPIHRALQEED
ncbi:protein kinase [Candidatus Hydrogenedentota bacterium]